MCVFWQNLLLPNESQPAARVNRGHPNEFRSWSCLAASSELPGPGTAHMLLSSAHLLVKQLEELGYKEDQPRLLFPAMRLFIYVVPKYTWCFVEF